MCGRDTIGLVVDFPARELVFLKNGKRQGKCEFAQDVKALYLVTHLDADGDQVELRPAGLSASMGRLRLQDSPRWGETRKGAPLWLKQTIKEAKDETNKAALGGSARAGIGVALVLVESIQTTVSLSSEQVSEILEALTSCFFLSAPPSSSVRATVCPLGHHLVMLSSGFSWTCDICETSQTGNQRLRCTQCDYDVCKSCTSGQFPLRTGTSTKLSEKLMTSIQVISKSIFHSEICLDYYRNICYCTLPLLKKTLIDYLVLYQGIDEQRALSKL
jgi:hypothetical protein